MRLRLTLRRSLTTLGFAQPSLRSAHQGAPPPGPRRHENSGSRELGKHEVVGLRILLRVFAGQEPHRRVALDLDELAAEQA
ncbi:MAG: hypothetical protein ACYS22_20260, partial [Planctomycetota bacterium]